MSQSIPDLEPKPLFRYFYELNQIPRCSKNEKQAGEYLLRLAERKKLEADQDQVGNTVIRVPGSPGRENKPIVVLQSHTDMVCEKNKETEHDFSRDPIRMRIEGDWITADGTTLGADNGIGVAAALAVIDERSEHGPLELLFTIDEETGLTGAYSLDPDLLKGKILINMDSEEEGELYIGCAGGKDTMGEFQILYTSPPEGWVPFRIEVKGLRGGHSGIDIHLGRGNAIKLLAETLKRLNAENPCYLAAIEGGSKRNAIAREAEAVIYVHQSRLDIVREYVSVAAHRYKSDYASTDPGVLVASSGVDETFDQVFTREATARLFGLLYSLPHGVIAMSADVPGLVETSTNLATVRIQNSSVIIGTSQRSAIDAERDKIAATVSGLMSTAGAAVRHTDGYPGWKPNLESRTLAMAKKIFTEFYEKEPELKAIHAGLECGIIGKKYPDMDMISFGPTITGAHSPTERVYIPAVRNFYRCVLLILKKLSD